MITLFCFLNLLSYLPPQSSPIMLISHVFLTSFSSPSLPLHLPLIHVPLLRILPLLLLLFGTVTNVIISDTPKNLTLFFIQPPLSSFLLYFFHFFYFAPPVLSPLYPNLREWRMLSSCAAWVLQREELTVVRWAFPSSPPRYQPHPLHQPHLIAQCTLQWTFYSNTFNEDSFVSSKKINC